MSAFHRWLLKHRPYCELCSGPYPSMRIGQINGKNTALCDAHWRANHPIEAGYQHFVDRISVMEQSRRKLEEKHHNDKIRNSPNAVS